MKPEVIVFPGRNPRYAEYLNSPEWKARRKAVKKRCNNVCERCRKYLVDEVHHLTYDRLFNEPLEDLQGLCRPCHAFLHHHSGIDPLAESIVIKVTWKRLEYWDSEAKKFRQVSREKLEQTGPKPKWVVGKYRVPMTAFLDADGIPVFDPGRWQKYQIASKIGKHWYHSEERGRSIPPSPEAVQQHREEMKRAVIQQEQTKGDEEQRQKECPASYTSYQGKAPKYEREVMALFRRYPKVIEHGQECKLLGVRSTFRMGIVLDLECPNANGGLMRCKIYEAERKLNNGSILLDHDRGIWVMKEQPRIPSWVLAKWGINEQGQA